MLAKGRLLGIQFDELFTDDLYFKISEKAVRQAKRIAKACEDAGCAFFAPRRRTSSSPFSRILRSKSSRKSTSIPIGRAWTKHTAPSAFVQAGRRRTKTWTHSAKTLRPPWQNNAGLRLSAPFRGGKPV